MKRLFRNVYVVVMDDAGTEHEDGWVLVELDGYDGDPDEAARANREYLRELIAG